MLSLGQLSQMVKEHLGLYTSDDGILHFSKWVIAESSVAGRGLFATEDILPGEVLFVDHPLISGPRAASIEIEPHGCTVCCKIDAENTFKCPKCGLLLCSEQCQSDNVHFNDCNVISRWVFKIPVEDFDYRTVPRALTAIRALLLNDDQKQLLSALQAHVLPQHGTEIRDLQEYFEIPESEVEFMRLACCVLDANAYQIATAYGKKEMSRRGLYPVSALMNHNCVPNTKYSYNSEAQMTVKASKHIQAGTEIFTCYSGFLWGTPSRQAQLYKTKHFLCKCDRCADPTERGTMLAALKCFSTECPGNLLPIQPLNTTSAWQCLECGLRVPRKNIGAVQSAVGSLLGSVNFGSVDSLEKFLTTRITKYIPKTNQVVVDLQCCLIWEFGEAEGLRWHELSEGRLALKESLCRGTLRTAAALGAGDAHLRGRLLYHLHAALAERARRCPDQYEELKPEIESTIEQAYSILQGDISAPPDLDLRRRYLGPGCDKPQHERFFILDA
ncbi:SET domain-containing protein SmydA-8-like isoform X1 [Choristoneura fumiferana]|uniref:SET domain-containing protein SmydA-8-like isoform X1 n=1 Tax=Choristoneura fumiferana TaxID=7141 RepID=UPI003D157E99